MNNMPMPMPHSKDGCSPAMMNMQFHQNLNDPLLFSSIYTCSAFWYGVLCFVVVLLGILNEYVKSFRRTSMRNRVKLRDSPTLDPLITNVNDAKKPANKQKGKLSVITFFTLSIDYLLMLIAMTFNCGYFFSTIFGLVIGKYLFAFDDESEMESRTLSEANCC